MGKTASSYAETIKCGGIIACDVYIIALFARNYSTRIIEYIYSYIHYYIYV